MVARSLLCFMQAIIRQCLKLVNELCSLHSLTKMLINQLLVDGGNFSSMNLTCSVVPPVLCIEEQLGIQFFYLQTSGVILIIT